MAKTKTASTNKKGKAAGKVKVKRQTYSLALKATVRVWRMVDHMPIAAIRKKLEAEYRLVVPPATLYLVESRKYGMGRNHFSS